MIKTLTILFVDEKERQLSTLVPGQASDETTLLNVQNGREAWDVLRSTEGRDVGLIVCSANLPEGEGTLLLQRVRASGLETPFIFLTAAESNAKIPNLAACMMVQASEVAQRLPEEVKKVLQARKGKKGV